MTSCYVKDADREEERMIRKMASCSSPQRAKEEGKGKQK